MLDELVGTALATVLDGLSLAVVMDTLGLDLPVLFRGDPPELRAAYESATQTLAGDPSNVEAHFIRGVICQGKGWHQGALADFVEVVKLQPRHPRAWPLLAEVLGNLGEYDKAKVARDVGLKLEAAKSRPPA